jgi:hypothetical protein
MAMNALDDLTKKTYLNGNEIIARMLKEIILCDYNRQDYKLPEPKRPDYLGIMSK